MDDFGVRLGQVFPRYSDVFTVGSEFIKGDKGNYYTFTVVKSRKSSDEEKEAAHRWTNILGAAKNVSIDESDLENQKPREAAKPVTHENEGRDF